jgi:hypothetical protein
MIFNKKTKCPNCNSKVKQGFSFCPHCGADVTDPEKERKDFGLLGKEDSYEEPIQDPFSMPGLNFMAKMAAPIVNKLMKEMEKEFQKSSSKNTDPEVTRFPNGIRISVGYPGMPQQKSKKNSKPKNPAKKTITPEQMQKMSKLPRTQAKSSVKRLNNKVVYELTTPGVDSVDDIFLSKLESGYEIKAIGNKKVYVNSLPVELPLKSLSIVKDKLLVEFNPDQE